MHFVPFHKINRPSQVAPWPLIRATQTRGRKSERYTSDNCCFSFRHLKLRTQHMKCSTWMLPKSQPETNMKGKRESGCWQPSEWWRKRNGVLKWCSLQVCRSMLSKIHQDIIKRATAQWYVFPLYSPRTHSFLVFSNKRKTFVTYHICFQKWSL